MELDPLDPYGPPEPTWVNAADGTYAISTNVELSGHGDDNTLHAYADAPGTTLLAVAADAQLPSLAALRVALPPDLAAQLPAWFDQVLGGNWVALLAAWGQAEGLRLLAADATIESTLVIAGSQVHHTLSVIDFAESTEDQDRFALGALAGETVDATATAEFVPSTKGGSINIVGDDLDTVIALGEYTYQLADHRGGSSMRELLGTATQCPLVAIAVANQCGDAACVASLPLLTELCERGLDEIFAQTHAQVATTWLHIRGGGAVLVDRDTDGITDRLDGGWVSGDPTLTPYFLPFSGDRH